MDAHAGMGCRVTAHHSAERVVCACGCSFSARRVRRAWEGQAWDGSEREDVEELGGLQRTAED
jgi:hypothetical protein